MKESDVVVYVSESNKFCEKVIALMEKYNVNYKVKNVTKDRQYMKELQADGVFGTPTLFVPGNSKPIQGYQKEKILQALGKVPN